MKSQLDTLPTHPTKTTYPIALLWILLTILTANYCCRTRYYRRLSMHKLIFMLCDYNIRFSSGQILFVPLLFFFHASNRIIFSFQMHSLIAYTSISINYHNIPVEFFCLSICLFSKSFSLLVPYQSPSICRLWYNERFVCIASYPSGLAFLLW